MEIIMKWPLEFLRVQGSSKLQVNDRVAMLESWVMWVRVTLIVRVLLVVKKIKLLWEGVDRVLV